MSEEGQPREAICRLGASLFDRGLTAGSSGNISVRVADGFLMTPTNVSLGRLDPARLSKLDEDGNLVSGRTFRDHGHYMGAWMRLLNEERERMRAGKTSAAGAVREPVLA